ncbi:MAG: hypothetical protein R2827_13760 [Bdellovibrionales bacterium]
MNTKIDSMMYELYVKDISENQVIKQAANHTVKEIQAEVSTEADVHISVEPEPKGRKNINVTLSVFGFRDPIVVKKRGRNILSVFKKVKKTALRRIRSLKRKNDRIHKKKFFKEQFAS